MVSDKWVSETRVKGATGSRQHSDTAQANARMTKSSERSWTRWRTASARREEAASGSRDEGAAKRLETGRRGRRAERDAPYARRNCEAKWQGKG